MRALGRLTVIALSAMLFVAGVVGAVYYSLRSPEVNVPKVVGNDRFSAEDALKQAGLNMRVRASRYSPNAKADTVLDQNPRAGEIVKAGQTIAVVVSRTQAREGEEAIAQAELEAAELAEEANSAVNSNRQNTNDNRAVSVLARTNANNRARNTNANNRNANNANNTNNGNATNDNGNANQAANVNNATNAANTNTASNANRTNANAGNANRTNANNANRNTTSNANNRNANNRNSNNRNAGNTNTRNSNNRTAASPANRNTRT